MDQRIRVAVVFGGRSSEHAISCVSAGSVLSALDRGRYDVVPIGLTPDGRWVLEADDPERLRITDGKLPEVDATGVSLVLAGDPTRHDLEVHAPGDVPATLAGVDVVFPVLHGPYGEDGTIQGLLELAGVPYVGSGVLASAAAMDKGAMKALLAHAGLEQAPYTVVTDRDWRRDRAGALARAWELGFPLFVKPARAGSSVGISKVRDAEGLVAAIEAAREHDPRVVVEAAVEGAREVECGVLVDEHGEPQASVCAEIVVHGDHEFYDFEAKYLEDAADLVVPADLPPEVSERVRELSVRAFDALSCEGLARCDFFVTADGRVLVNEVNTMPGFTAISMFPRVWAASGVDYPALVDRLVADALRRGTGLR
ncbi:MAG: D-alanine--D-alanine ligase [Frankiales bacterium]|nr:D-alanine--D-alanine ligase [Frankiales bacterium]